MTTNPAPAPAAPTRAHELARVEGLAAACATVRESMRATETDLNDAAEQAQFAKDYGTDADIQRHVLDWAYMYEAPSLFELEADPAYAKFCTAWEYIMAHGTHPASK